MCQVEASSPLLGGFSLHRIAAGDGVPVEADGGFSYTRCSLNFLSGFTKSVASALP